MKGWNAWLASAASKVVVPVAPTRTGAGALPRSQSVSGAYAAATELALMSLLVLLVMTFLAPRREARK